MKQLYVNSCGVRLAILVKGDAQLMQEFLESGFWYECIPNLTLSETDAAFQSSLTIEWIKAQEFQFTKARRKLIVGHEEDIKAAIALVEYYLESLRQRKGLFSVHGNIISKENLTIALVGGVSGTGKTTLSVESQANGWRWISDEKFIIDSKGRYIAAVSGTLDDDKTRGVLNNLSPATALGTAHPLPINLFVFPIVTHEIELTAHLFTEQKAVWHYYEELSRDIRIANSLHSGDTPLPSLDSQNTSRRRLEASRSFSTQIPCYYIRGNSPAILTKITQLQE